MSATVTTSSKPKVLIILSSSDHVTITKPDGSKVEQPTGCFMKELTVPLRMIIEAGYEPIFANPLGNTAPIDPISDSFIWYPLAPSAVNADRELIANLESFKHPIKFSEVTDEVLKSCEGVFVPGGHAPMEDLGGNTELGRILVHFHSERKPTALICHGPYALLSTRPSVLHSSPPSPFVSDGPTETLNTTHHHHLELHHHTPQNSLSPHNIDPGLFPYRGYKVSCYSNIEETANEWMWWGSLEPRCQTALEEEGVEVVTNLVPLRERVVRDREVVSGENPSSAEGLGKEFVGMLGERRGGKREWEA